MTGIVVIFVNLVLLYKGEDTCFAYAISCVDRSVSTDDGGLSKQSNPRKYLEEEYLETEKKVTILYPAS